MEAFWLKCWFSNEREGVLRKCGFEIELSWNFCRPDCSHSFRKPCLRFYWLAGCCRWSYRLLQVLVRIREFDIGPIKTRVGLDFDERCLMAHRLRPKPSEKGSRMPAKLYVHIDVDVQHVESIQSNAVFGSRCIGSLW